MTQESIKDLDSLINTKFLDTLRQLSEALGSKVPLDILKSHSGMDDDTFEANLNVLSKVNKLTIEDGSMYGIKMQFVELLN